MQSDIINEELIKLYALKYRNGYDKTLLIDKHLRDLTISKMTGTDS